MLRKLFCTTCDPWQAHLYGTEWNPTAFQPFAYFCWDYCGAFYHACATEYMYWNRTPSGINLFGGMPSTLFSPLISILCRLKSLSSR